MHKIEIDGIPIKHKFHYENNDLHLPQPKGGFIGSLLSGLIPLGIDLISGLFKKKSGQGVIQDNPNHRHMLKIYKNKNLVGEHEISHEAGAILMDKSLIKMIHKHKGDLERVANGVYGEGVYGQGVYGQGAASSMHGGSQLSMNALKTGTGVYGGRIGNLKNIN